MPSAGGTAVSLQPEPGLGWALAWARHLCTPHWHPLRHPCGFKSLCPSPTWGRALCVMEVRPSRPCPACSGLDTKLCCGMSPLWWSTAGHHTAHIYPTTQTQKVFWCLPGQQSFGLGGGTGSSRLAGAQPCCPLTSSKLPGVTLPSCSLCSDFLAPSARKTTPLPGLAEL